MNDDNRIDEKSRPLLHLSGEEDKKREYQANATFQFQ
jgi:hypothetical protein